MKTWGTIYQALICITQAVWILLIERLSSNYFDRADGAAAVMDSSVHPDHFELVMGFTTHLSHTETSHKSFDASKREGKMHKEQKDKRLPELPLPAEFHLQLYLWSRERYQKNVARHVRKPEQNVHTWPRSQNSWTISVYLCKSSTVKRHQEEVHGHQVKSYWPKWLGFEPYFWIKVCFDQFHPPGGMAHFCPCRQPWGY